MRRPLIVAGLVLMAGTPGARAFCSAPSTYLDVPDAPASYSRPDVPFCLQGSAYSGTHTCDDWELNNYQREVERYVDELRNYAAEARAMAEEAIDFANSAVDYVNCEADDVVSQHR